MTEEMRTENQVTRALRELGDGPGEARLNQQLRRFQAHESKPQGAARFGLSLPAVGACALALIALFFVVRQQSPLAWFGGPERSAGSETAIAIPTPQVSAEARVAVAPAVQAASALAAIEGQARQPLRAHAGERYLSAGDEVIATTGERLDFDGAGIIQLKPQSHGEVLELSQDSFGMRLDRGKLEATITKGLGNHFRILASNFEVQVIGTVFSVEWQPKDSKFNVAVTRGQVAVTDLQSGQRTLLSAGQSFSAEGDVSSLSPKSGAAHSIHAVHANPEEQPKGRSLAEQLPNSGASKTRTELAATQLQPDNSKQGTSKQEHEPVPQVARPEWQLLAEAGEYQAAYGAAKLAGVSKLRDEGTPSELLLLADSARLSGATDDAKQTLRSLRKRYPTHQSASVASFVLGRIAFEQHHDAEAVSWLQSYLSEQPNGPLAEGARARMLTVTQRSGDPSATRAAAEEYLRFHPTGQRAKDARRVLGK